jgi:hypothetical protein
VLPVICLCLGVTTVVHVHFAGDGN